MIGDNNPIVILAVIAVCLALIRGIAIEGARMENYRRPMRDWLPDEDCKEVGNLALLLVILGLGACGLLYFAVNLLAGRAG